MAGTIPRFCMKFLPLCNCLNAAYSDDEVHKWVLRHITLEEYLGDHVWSSFCEITRHATDSWDINTPKENYKTCISWNTYKLFWSEYIRQMHNEKWQNKISKQRPRYLASREDEFGGSQNNWTSYKKSICDPAHIGYNGRPSILSLLVHILYLSIVKITYTYLHIKQYDRSRLSICHHKSIDGQFISHYLISPLSTDIETRLSENTCSYIGKRKIR